MSAIKNLRVPESVTALLTDELLPDELKGADTSRIGIWAFKVAAAWARANPELATANILPQAVESAP
jgi:hypothetical protein